MALHIHAAFALAAIAIQPVAPASIGALDDAAFRLNVTSARLSGDYLHVSGTICRRPNRIAVSPARVEIDRLSGDAELIEAAYAYPSAISRRIDHPCGHFSGVVAGPTSVSDAIKVCIARAHRHCVDGHAKARQP